MRLDVERGEFAVVAEIAELSSVAEGTSLWATLWPGELVRLEAATGEVQARIEVQRFEQQLIRASHLPDDRG